MKKFVVTALIVAIIATAANGQCQKKVTWTSEKTEFLDASGKVQDVKTQPTKIETTLSHIKVTTEDGVFEGDIRELACQWKEPFKNGRTGFTSLMAKLNGESRNVSITIEWREGKIDSIVGGEHGWENDANARR